MVPEELLEVTRHALEDGRCGLRQFAADSGLSYDVLRSWRSGRRKPSRQSVERLAGGFERRAERLHVLAGTLRSALERSGSLNEAARTETPVGQTF